MSARSCHRGSVVVVLVCLISSTCPTRTGFYLSIRRLGLVSVAGVSMGGLCGSCWSHGAGSTLGFICSRCRIYGCCSTREPVSSMPWSLGPQCDQCQAMGLGILSYLSGTQPTIFIILSRVATFCHRPQWRVSIPWHRHSFLYTG